MPEERDIEKKLRAAATQRRADAGEKFALHPATRRVLQGEIARTRPQPRVGGARRFWPRFAWGVSMLAVLAVGVWSLTGPKLAQQNSPRPAPAAPAALSSEAEFKNAAANEPLPTAQLDAAVSADAKASIETASVAPASAPVGAAEKSSDSVRRATSPAAKLDSIALAEAPRREALPAQQNAWQLYNFSNQSANRSATEDRVGFARTAAKKPFTQSAATSVLNNFQFEQTGNAVRIVDGDGSVYTGALLADVTDKKEIAQKDLAKVASPMGAAATKHQDSLALNFRFTASGSNVSLRQRVLVNADFFAVTSNAIPGLSQNWNNVSDQQLKTKLQYNLRAPGSRLVGRAVTADGQAVELDATETPTR